ncbi:MAG: AI-2E family transporter, partial [bacterium]|nr:AI-2E family transporter [bacterium]
MSSYIQKNILENHFLIGIGIVAGALLLWEIHGILVSLFIAYIISTALSPAVDFLVTKKLNRTFSVILVFLATIAVLAIVIFPLIPFMLDQIQSFIRLFPRYLERAGQFDLAGIMQSEINAIGRNAFSLTSKVFGGVFSVISTIVISFYFLLNRADIVNVTTKIFGAGHQIDSKLGAWVRGQLLLSLIIGVFTWLGLTIIGVPQAFPLAIIAGALEIIPTLGPILSAIPALIVALTIS